MKIVKFSITFSFAQAKVQTAAVNLGYLSLSFVSPSLLFLQLLVDEVAELERIGAADCKDWSTRLRACALNPVCIVASFCLPSFCSFRFFVLVEAPGSFSDRYSQCFPFFFYLWLCSAYSSWCSAVASRRSDGLLVSVCF